VSLASANSLASEEEMVLPAAKREAGDAMVVADLTKVTAIVSPMARPSPSRVAPTTPLIP